MTGAGTGARGATSRSRPIVRAAFLRRLAFVAAGTFAVVTLVRAFLLQTVVVQGASMQPALDAGDVVLVNRLAYAWGDPRRGDVIAFTIEADRVPDRRTIARKTFDVLRGLGLGVPPYRKFMKRVIGLPGETVEISAGSVTITPPGGAPFRLDEPYLDDTDASSYGPIVVPKDSYFALGDNRAASIDSRSGLGFVRRNDVIGRVFLRAWPPARWGLVRRPSFPAAAGLAAVVTAPRFSRRRYPRARREAA